ncbi:hypothetical protein F5Y10DRAFT_229292 [Nemania abortiva]|nr:hypothetical protein F5Y10DRAFT_229292 [Nemania abortiva]
MPRKVRLPADPAQSRANQQRSRARHREYVASLEARVRELENRGAQATLEMQRAAREVAWVNERLIELLTARGVSREEVDGFLRRRGTGGDPETTAGRRASGPRRASSSDVTPVEMVGVPVNNREESADEQNRARVSITTANGPNPDIDAATGTDTSHSSRVVNRDDADADADADADEGFRALVTSCDDAASIIADFQGHGDVSHARKALGCGDATNCHVKNTRLFQLMDETGRH